MADQSSLASVRICMNCGLCAGSGMIPFLAQLLDSAHTATGQPWWVIITSAVIAVRMVAIPLSIRGMAAGSRLRSVTPYMGLYRKQQEEAARRQDKQAIRAAMAQVSQLQKQYGTSFLTIASPIVLQMVMGIWMFTSLRRMGLEAEGIDGFLFEGLPWATDLSASEYTLPAIVTIAGLITAELSKSIAPKNPPPGSFNPDTMRNISRGFAVFGGAVMTTLPAVRRTRERVTLHCDLGRSWRWPRVLQLILVCRSFVVNAVRHSECRCDGCERGCQPEFGAAASGAKGLRLRKGVARCRVCGAPWLGCRCGPAACQGV